MPLLTSQSRESVQAPEQAVACLLSALQSPPLLFLALLNAKAKFCLCIYVFVMATRCHHGFQRLLLPSKVPRRSVIFQSMKSLVNPGLLPVFFLCDLLHAQTHGSNPQTECVHQRWTVLPSACDCPALDLLEVAALAGEGTAWVPFIQGLNSVFTLGKGEFFAWMV